MRKLLLFLFVGLIFQQCFSQKGIKRIRISNDIELIQVSDNAFVHVSFTEMSNFGRVGSNGVVFINNGEAFLFDTPMTEKLTKDLVDWLTDSWRRTFHG